MTRGLLIYCKQGLQATELSISGSNTFTECTGITIPWELGQGNNNKLSLVLVYKPPKDPGSAADLGNTERLCELLTKLEGTVVTVGDYNLPGVDWDRCWSNKEGEQLVVDTFADMFWTHHGPSWANPYWS